MRYLAILKDSLREAIDFKIIYVMFGLSALVTLIVASMSFTPQKADRLMQEVVNGNLGRSMRLVQRAGMGVDDARSGRHLPAPQLQSVTLLKGDADSPYSEYRLLVRLE